MKRITIGLILSLVLFAVAGLANAPVEQGPSVSKAKQTPVQNTATVQVAITTESQNAVKESIGQVQNAVKESIGQVPNAVVFNVWKPVQTRAGYRTVETPPNIYS